MKEDYSKVDHSMLCKRCAYGHMRESLGKTIVICGYGDRERVMPFVVTKCSDFEPNTNPKVFGGMAKMVKIIKGRVCTQSRAKVMLEGELRMVHGYMPCYGEVWTETEVNESRNEIFGD